MRPVDTIEEGLVHAQWKLGEELDVAMIPLALLTLSILPGHGGQRESSREV
jgi:hypothetical protein